MTASWHSEDFYQRSWRTWGMLLLDAFSHSRVLFCDFVTLVSNKDTFVMIV
jgi:hypothetical protein